MAPAGATDDEGLPEDDSPSSAFPGTPDATDVGSYEGSTGTAGGDETAPVPGGAGPDESLVGPVGSVDVPTYEAVRGPGEVTPSSMTSVNTGENVMLVTFAPDDGSTFRAVLVIDGEEAASEYRFTKAVPEGHDAKIQPDGLIRFLDSQGEGAGGIAPPWAVDAAGNVVSTSFALDGDTLIQTVDHDGAVYPVIADPFWMTVVVVVLLYAPRVTVAATATYNTCARVQCGAAIRAIRENVPKSGSGGGSDKSRTKKNCNARNRSGC